MNPLPSAKFLPLYSAGTITASELATCILYDIVKDTTLDTDLHRLVADLPEELQQELRSLLREIQQANYCWNPTRFGGGGSLLASLNDDAARLRRVCELLDSGQTLESP